jgi:outer membrane receptor protein involved in Fe transport
VPPGTYDLQISYIGYRKVTIQNLRVNIDQTARYDIQLESQAIEVNVLVVVGDRMTIKKDVATSVASVSDKEITSLPIASVADVLGMQAGIGISNGGKDFYIRGSGSDQSLFMVDGATMRDPRNNQALFRVPLNSIKEISVERGGFNAEYGHVQAGIVNVVTNEGDNQAYSGGLTIKLTPPATKYYSGHGIPGIQDHNSYWLRPYFDPAVCWTGTTTPESQGGWDKYTIQQFGTFEGWNSVSQRLCTDNDPSNDLTPIGAQRAFLYETRKDVPNDQPDYNIDAAFGGPVPFIGRTLGNLHFFFSYRGERDVLIFPSTLPDYRDHDMRLVLNSDISSTMRLHLNGGYGTMATMSANWSYPHYLTTPGDLAGETGTSLFNVFTDEAYSLTDINYKSASVKLIQTLGANTYYEISVEHLSRHYYTRPTAERDTSNLIEVLPGFFETSAPYGYAPSSIGRTGVVLGGGGGQVSMARDNSTAGSTTIKADYTSQVNFSNLVKFGCEFNYNDLDLDYGFIDFTSEGKSYSTRVQTRDFPIKGAIYAQDKLETEGFTLNIGLRADYSNSRVDWWNTNPYDVSFITNRYSNALIYPMKDSKGQWQISPRLGISHPITENSKLFFNYGHFKEMPQYETLFRVSRSADNSLRQLGDPNLTLAKTISYELGYDHLLLDNFLFQITAYYRDISYQQNTTTYQTRNKLTYDLTTSTSYSDIRGVEITVRKSTGRWFSGFLNYTYQVTSNGNFGEQKQYEDPVEQEKYNANTVNLYQTKPIPTPNAKANLGFYTPGDFGPAFAGHNIFGNWRLDLLLNWSAGGWTTYNPQNVSGIVNNVQFVDYFDGTMRISKTISIYRFSLQMFLDINNLFNSLRLFNPYDQKYQESLHLPKSLAYSNIPGDDRFGDYRSPGVDWQPEIYQAEIQHKDGTFINAPDDTQAFFYESNSGKYWHVVKDQAGARSWAEVDQATIDKVNQDKAYIQMPNPSTFWFLNPRAFTVGIRLSMDLE